MSDRIINREEFLQLTNEEKAKYFIEKYRDISLRLAPRIDVTYNSDGNCNNE